MTLLGSLLPVMALLSLVLIIQGLTLTATDASKKDKLAKNIRKPTYILIILGCVMVIAGCIWWDLLKDAFIPVGITLIAAAITFLVQSKSLAVSGDEAVRFGRYVKVVAWVLFVVMIVGLGFWFFFFIRMALNWH